MPNELTPRELEVAKLTAAGYALWEISARLAISRNTVRNHRRAIYSKLGVKNAVQMTRKLTR